MGRKKSRQKRRLLGVYLLPTLFTLGNLGAGFYAIVQAVWSLQHPEAPRWEYACWAVVIALVCDGLDGRIARMTGTTSAFGVQLDSLADLLTFGVTPALLVYMRWLTDFPRIGWIVALAFVIGAALRLARFNIQASEEEGKGFTGMPAPAAASVPVSFMMVYDTYGHRLPHLTDDSIRVFMPWLLLGLAYLMFSTVRYPSFKHLNLRRKHPLGVLVLLTLLLYVLIIAPCLFYFGGATLYLTLPLLVALVRPHRKLATEMLAEADSLAGSEGDGR